MKTARYNRSQIYTGFDLTTDQQNEIMNTYSFEKSDVLNNSYVKFIDRTLNVEFLPLDMFMRTEGGIFNGVYGLSAFSAYFIKLSRDGNEALIAYKYC